MKKDEKESGSRKGFFGNISMKFGEVAQRLGLIRNSDIKEALAKQESDKSHRRIGNILVDDNKMTMEDVEYVVNNQIEIETVSTVMAAQAEAEKEPAETTAKKSVKKKPVKTTAKKSVKKKPAKKRAK